MPALLFYGRDESLVAVLAAAVLGVPKAQIVDAAAFLRSPLGGAPTAPNARLLIVELPEAGTHEAQRIAARETVRAARQSLPSLPIVVVYDSADRDQGVATLIDGADAILPKPFDLDAFRALLGRQTRRVDSTSGIEPSRPAGSSPTTHAGPSGALPPGGLPHPVETAPARPKAAPTAAVPTSVSVDPGAATTATTTAAPTTRQACRELDEDALPELVRRVAHEVNNPLTTIRGLLQLLLHDTHGDPAHDETMSTYRTIEGEARRISEVVDELEYFSGARRPARTMVDLGALLRDVLTELGVPVQDRVKSASLRLLADREQIRFAMRQQVGFLTRVDGPKSRELSVKLTRDGDWAIVRFRGRDRSLPDLDKVLLPLLCGADESGARWSLAGADGIARAHGGRVSVRRRNDRRVEICLKLPICDERTLRTSA